MSVLTSSLVWTGEQESLCEKANTKAEYLIKTAELFQKNFKSSYMEDRKKLLQNFDPCTN